MALHYIPGIDDRWNTVVQRGKDLIADLNKIKGLEISPLENGTNSYRMVLDHAIDDEKLANQLTKESNIVWLNRKNENGDFRFIVNESIMLTENKEILSAWKSSMKKART